MSATRHPLWTLDELSARVALALAVGYAGQANGRVRDVPDVRTIRYYTTLGLLDRPAAMRGRAALYGPRHLMQLVAIKRLQANGLTLAQVQERLLGLPPAKLRELARLPDALEGEPPTSPPPEPAAARDDFWKAPSAPVPPPSPAALVGVPLAAGVTLLLEARRDLDEHDTEALRAAAAPLLKLLTARRMVGSAQPPPSTKGDAG